MAPFIIVIILLRLCRSNLLDLGSVVFAMYNTSVKQLFWSKWLELYRDCDEMIVFSIDIHQPENHLLSVKHISAWFLYSYFTRQGCQLFPFSFNFFVDIPLQITSLSDLSEIYPSTGDSLIKDTQMIYSYLIKTLTKSKDYFHPFLNANIVSGLIYVNSWTNDREWSGWDLLCKSGQIESRKPDWHSPTCVTCSVSDISV